MAYLVREYNPLDRRDAERMAAMFNSFDSVWPGGFTRGVPETAESVLSRITSARRMAICVVECDDEIVGFCDLKEREGAPGVTYIPLLGASPGHHGKGVGKSLLLEMVRRVAEGGFRIVTLGTWSGNMKAVPLYKKTGFQWVPETTVRMRNYIPAVLNMPIGRDFFAHRDWYSCYVRDLSVKPDDISWHGMKVYPYEFRDGDNFLTVTFDAVSDGVTAIATPHWSAACYISTEEAPAGESVPITWEIDTGASGPRDVTILASADEGLETSLQESLSVEGRAVITRTLRVAPDTAPPHSGHPAYRVRSTILIGGEAVVFETGVKVVRPLEIETKSPALIPGRPERISVKLRNRLGRELTGMLALDSTPELTVQQPAAAYSIPAGGWTECEYIVTASRPGELASTLHYSVGETRCRRAVALRVLAGAGAVGSVERVDEELAVLETGDTRVTVSIRGGAMRIENTLLDRQVAHVLIAAPGPPYVDRRDRQPLLDTSIVRRPEGDSVITMAPSIEFPDIVVERAVSITAGGVVRIDHRVHNIGAAPISTYLRFRADYHVMPSYITLPTPAGLVREPMRGAGDFPGGSGDIMPFGASLTEGWLAIEADGMAIGTVWAGTPQLETDWESTPNLIFATGEIPAHGAVDLPPSYVVAGAGDWSLIRAWWRRLVQPTGVHELAAPTPAHVLEAHIDPAHALFAQDTNACKVVFVSRRGKRLSGMASITGDSFAVHAAPTAFEGLDRDNPLSLDCEISCPAELSAGYIVAAIDIGPSAESFRLPVARIASAGVVVSSTAADGRLIVDNGRMVLHVAPHFRGSVTSIEISGVNQLFSAYPETRPFMWSNPWYGGIYPTLTDWSADPILCRETFHGELIERTGAQGMHWHGVRVWCAMTHRDWSWLQIEAEYLTLPNSNVLAIVTRWVNRSDARMRTWGGIMAYLQPGGVRDGVVAHWQCEGELRERKRGGFPMEFRSSGIAAVSNPEADIALLLAATRKTDLPVLDDTGEEGVHIGIPTPLDVAPSAAEERLDWLAVCRANEPLDAWAAALGASKELP